LVPEVKAVRLQADKRLIINESYDELPYEKGLKNPSDRIGGLASWAGIPYLEVQPSKAAHA
jgi:hypothetical protein